MEKKKIYGGRRRWDIFKYVQKNIFEVMGNIYFAFVGTKSLALKLKLKKKPLKWAIISSWWNDRHASGNLLILWPEKLD